MKKILVIFIFSVFFLSTGIIVGKYLKSKDSSDLPNLKILPQRPFDKYTIENLSKAEVNSGTLELGSKIAMSDKYESYHFNLNFSPDFKTEKNVSGQINIPNGHGPFPLIIMLRGYVDQKLYKTGDGTRSAAKFFVEKGFITIAPDFLGYGNSSSEAGNIFESRFQTYTTVLALTKTIKKDVTLAWDHKNIFIWGHSNGGQIALTVLEINKESYPTVLWAPVSKPFPYSILYYTDESEDRGKLIRSELAKFESLYDVELYSLVNYLDRINAPIQIHQGTADDAVPSDWSETLATKLKNLDKDLTFYVYPGADHNLKPSWDTVVERDLEFYRNHLSD